MSKVIKIILILFFINFSTSINAHVEHYENLNEIEFDIYRNNKFIGKHIFTFVREDDKLLVNSNVNFEIKKLGVVLYKYNATGIHIIFKDHPSMVKHLSIIYLELGGITAL